MQIASWLNEHLDAKGVGVVIEAEHSLHDAARCPAAGSNTVTSALLEPCAPIRAPGPSSCPWPGPGASSAHPDRTGRAQGGP